VLLWKLEGYDWMQAITTWQTPYNVHHEGFKHVQVREEKNPDHQRTPK
jgi:hypothetical protein